MDNVNKILFWAKTPNDGKCQKTEILHPSDCTDASLGEILRDWLWNEVVTYGWEVKKTIGEVNHVNFWVETPNGGRYEEIKKVHELDSDETMYSEIFRDWLWDEVIEYGWEVKGDKEERKRI